MKKIAKRKRDLANQEILRVRRELQNFKLKISGEKDDVLIKATAGTI